MPTKIRHSKSQSNFSENFRTANCRNHQGTFWGSYLSPSTATPPRTTDPTMISTHRMKGTSATNDSYITTLMITNLTRQHVLFCCRFHQCSPLRWTRVRPCFEVVVGRFVYTERSLDMILRELFSAFLIAFLIALTLHKWSTEYALCFRVLPHTQYVEFRDR